MITKLKKLIMGVVLFAGLIPSSAHAFGLEEFDKSLNEFIEPFTTLYSNTVFTAVTINGQDLPLIVVWLAMGSIFCTFYFKFINFRGFKTALKIVRGDYTKKGDAGEVSHFQALTAALSGTVGLGNIGGVAVAISLGGPGATVWMILVGLFGMSAKFAECTLGVKYRIVHEDGSVSGGPMYYLKNGFAEKGMPKLGLGLAIFFSICCVFASFGGGNIFQISQTVQQFQIVAEGHTNFFVDYRWAFGLIIATIVGLVIIGGIRSIANVTSKLVPVMCIFYLLAATSILLGYYEQVPDAFMSIINGAFTPEAGYGGLIGVMIQGMRRATFSNEAGIGSAPIAHAAVKTDEPATEGLVSLLEPFIDTVVVCTMTALVIVITGVYQDGTNLSGVKLTSEAFSSVYSWFPIVLAIAVLLFAISTMITWSYYGIKAWTFLFGESKTMEITYKLLFCCVTVIGATMSLTQVVNFADAANFSMAIPNIIGIFVLAPVVGQCLKSFMGKIDSGEIKSNREIAAAKSAE
ncbi:alanine/glycine:cation symporter family protein [Paremcibacter congregatus]|uniref:Alanine glycine permease n=1 Tax=Paremcibacter congregatus TaxID=2043170 RepID=A0A2G4YLW9_9PROT|nr:alanine/glycine:cation symporter family protein [Paremcibacter congregatus]PHZ83319.1 alanine glycine permease [Paremcibacter congregatus]QDE28208.1 alanine:cation symporter family protein [Paremcibacter congregatus]